MSADNYMHILKRGGKYVVQNRSASAYYADEGHTVESLQQHYDECYPGQYDVDASWLVPADVEHGHIFDTLAEAEEYAYSEYSEYGVSYGFPVKRHTVEVEDES